MDYSIFQIRFSGTWNEIKGALNTTIDTVIEATGGLPSTQIICSETFDDYFNEFYNLKDGPWYESLKKKLTHLFYQYVPFQESCGWEKGTISIDATVTQNKLKVMVTGTGNVSGDVKHTEKTLTAFLEAKNITYFLDRESYWHVDA